MSTLTRVLNKMWLKMRINNNRGYVLRAKVSRKKRRACERLEDKEKDNEVEARLDPLSGVAQAGVIRTT